jgi:hypothetical protein
VDDHLCLVSLMTDPTARWSLALFTCRRRSGRRWLRWRGIWRISRAEGTWRAEWFCNRETARSRHSVPRAGAFGASSILSRQSGLCQANLESGVECHRVPANWGPFPQTPSEGVPPPHPPCYWRTFKPTGAAQSLGGDHKGEPGHKYSRAGSRYGYVGAQETHQ